MATTFRNMTTEHLGDEATDADLREFQEACERVMASTQYDRDEEAATDYVWNDGSIRFNADACAYCDHVVADRTMVPAGDDNLNWGALESEHEDDCEWLNTRAHQLPC